MKSHKFIGFVQAALLIIYVSAFAIFVQQVQSWLFLRNLQPNQFSGVVLFLLAFIISALVCGSIVFAYPALTFFTGNRIRAIKILSWNLIWLIVMSLVIAIVSLLSLAPKF